MIIETAITFKLFLVSVLALLLDRILGEPRLHPLVWFGNIAGWLETRINNGKSIGRGALASLILIAPVVGVTGWLTIALGSWSSVSLLFDILVLSFVVGWQSMKEHAMAVYQSLSASDIAGARANLGKIVSRDTHRMDNTQIAGSTMESILENGNDCLFASLFWYAVAGPPGAILHRLVNTLDAMWGYRSPRYNRFGRFVARLDDVMGWVPARLVAFGYALSGSTFSALRCWQAQGRRHDSPNAGLVMAAGAGALKRRIGGPMRYQGQWHDKPWLGCGQPATAGDIPGTTRLVHRALAVWLGIFLFTGIVSDQAKSGEFPAPLANAARKLCETAAESACGRDDDASLAGVYAHKSGITLPATAKKQHRTLPDNFEIPSYFSIIRAG